MGLASPVMLTPKILLQDLIKEGKSWDKPVEGSELRRWKRWLGDLPLIEELRVPRCMKLGVDDESQQLHVFADASEKGYGVAIYVRSEAGGIVDSNILYGRSRLAPLKKMTIPRLELTAATLAVKCASLVQEEIDSQFKDVIFWTDSMLVINYIRNTKTRFSTFVANRLSIIHDGTECDQWRHVDTENNPADLASRGMHLSKKDEVEMWLKGPEFLRNQESKWPKGKLGMPLLSTDDPEVKHVAAAITMADSTDPIELFLRNFLVGND